jgi:hypothetical protein
MAYAIILEGAGGSLEVHTPREALDIARSLAKAGPGKVVVRHDGVAYSLTELEKAVQSVKLG